MEKIILFDGECNFCNKSVQFIIAKDPKAHFKFASLKSNIGQQLLKQFNVLDNNKSLILIDDNQYYSQSTAVLNICKHLKLFWNFLYIFIIVPRPIRDFIYHIIAQNRYRWFGKNKKCIIPTTDTRNRFL